jgi:hypothetical protein
MCEDFAPSFDDKRIGCYITTTDRHIFPFITKNNITIVCHPPDFSVFPIEDKTERPPFWQNWGDGGRNSDGAEHDFQDAFKKNGKRRTKLCIRAEDNNFEGDGQS